VGSIASEHLSDEAEAKANQLLDGASLAEVATWADVVRNTSDYEWTGPLHYANVPDDAEEFVFHRDCPESGCVVSAIMDYSGVLQDPNANAEDKTEALKFLVHFVGDVHQPVHVGYASDRGANLIRVDFFDRHNVKLHAVWDTLLIKREHPDWQQYAGQINSSITAQMKSQWQTVTDPSDWANESFQVLVTDAYVNDGTPVTSGTSLSQSYYSRTLPLAEKRLAMGGIRLACLLNTIFVAGDDTGAAEPKYVGSRRSEVYHHPECAIVKTIKQKNLVQYQSKPAGKRLHKGCPWGGAD
jgi:hypothetical protein